jgi:hypothetical protein
MRHAVFLTSLVGLLGWSAALQPAQAGNWGISLSWSGGNHCFDGSRGVVYAGTRVTFGRGCDTRYYDRAPRYAYRSGRYYYSTPTCDTYVVGGTRYGGTVYRDCAPRHRVVRSTKEIHRRTYRSGCDRTYYRPSYRHSHHRNYVHRSYRSCDTPRHYYRSHHGRHHGSSRVYIRSHRGSSCGSRDYHRGGRSHWRHRR